MNCDCDCCASVVLSCFTSIHIAQMAPSRGEEVPQRSGQDAQPRAKQEFSPSNPSRLHDHWQATECSTAPSSSCDQCDITSCSLNDRCRGTECSTASSAECGIMVALR